MDVDHAAWNRFVQSEPDDYAPGDIRRDAAIAGYFSGVNGNGGPVHSLDVMSEFSGDEIVASLRAVGAVRAASEMDALLGALGEPLPKADNCERKQAVARLVTEEIELEFPFSEEAEQELDLALEAHVRAHSDHYRSKP